MIVLDLSTRIALTALVCSAASPFLSALLTGLFSLRIRKLELRHEEQVQQTEYSLHHRAAVIERFISSAGAVIGSNGTEKALEDFGNCCGEIYLYLDQTLWPDVDHLYLLISESHWSDARLALMSLCKKLSSEKLRPEYKK